MYRRKDAFYHRAKDAGFRSRAAFKLIELARSERLFKAGDRVLDLGAWPGGWSQVAAELVGPRGHVVAVDRRPIEALNPGNTEVIVGDLTDPAIEASVLAACAGGVHVLLSDLAPSLTGIRARDEAQGAQLVELVLHYAERLLRPGGSLLIKLFMSGEFTGSHGLLKRTFEQVRILRPEATRKGSAELYALARRYRGAPPVES